MVSVARVRFGGQREPRSHRDVGRGSDEGRKLWPGIREPKLGLGSGDTRRLPVLTSSPLAVCLYQLIH